MEVNTSISAGTASSSASQARLAQAAPELEPSRDAAKAAQAKAASSEILSGPGVRLAEGDTLVEQLISLRHTASPDQAVALTNMMKSYFDTMMNTAKNMAPNEEQKARELERRKEELEKQIRDLEAKKVTVEEALMRFENTFLAAADKELLESNMARQHQTMV